MSRKTDIEIPDYFPGDLPKFKVGDVVEHKVYKYRGVIVDFDMSYQGTEEWYKGNKQKGKKDCPWYHILVHKSNGNAYVVEESLDFVTARNALVQHPLLTVFFECTDEGEHIRNDEHWPGWPG